MINVKFLLRNPKEGENTISVRVKDGRRLDLTSVTKEKVYLEDWDASKGELVEIYLVVKNGKQVKKNDAATKAKIAENRIVNDRLRKLRKKIEDSYKSENTTFNNEWLKSIAIPPIVEKPFEYDFEDYCDVFLEQKGKDISNAYVTKVKSLKKIVNGFKKSNKIRKIGFMDFDLTFKAKFEDYFLKVENYSVNYLERSFKFIKTILYHAETNGYTINPSVKNLKIKGEKTDFQILSFDELEQITQKTFEKDHLSCARDWLVISCFTGQRISDFMRFNTSMISEKLVGDANKYFIEFEQVKTKKSLVLPLHEKVLEILRSRNWSFPARMSEARYNEHIKEVCRLSGLTSKVKGAKVPTKETKTVGKAKNLKVKGEYCKYELITSHIGRRSFASNYFGKIPTSLLMTATGHSTENMLHKYIGKIDLQQSMALAEYF